MEPQQYTTVAIGLGVVLVLLAVFYYALKHFSGQLRVGKWRPGQRIGVTDMAPVDGTRRLVLVRRDNVEHLVLLGEDGDLVVESGIPVQPGDYSGPERRRSWPSLRLGSGTAKTDAP